MVFPLKHTKQPSEFDKLNIKASFKGLALNWLRSGISSLLHDGIRELNESLYEK